MKDKLGCCCLNCEKCDAKLATVHDDDELRKKTSKLWSSLNGVDITPEMINCYGCRSGGVKTYFCENLCAVRKCVSAKKYQTCADCLEMRKCKTVEEIFSGNPEALNKKFKRLRFFYALKSKTSDYAKIEQKGAKCVRFA